MPCSKGLRRGSPQGNVFRPQRSRPIQIRAFNLSCSRFTRRYWGNHCYFLFLRLVICLNSAGRLTSFEIRIKGLSYTQAAYKNLSHLLPINIRPVVAWTKKDWQFENRRCFLLVMQQHTNQKVQSKEDISKVTQTRRSGTRSPNTRQDKLQVKSATDCCELDQVSCCCLNVSELIWNWFSKKHAPRDNTKERNLRSKFWWFTEFCNSHYVSHFAAFFIVARTKISIAKSCSMLTFINLYQDFVSVKFKSKLSSLV